MNLAEILLYAAAWEVLWLLEPADPRWVAGNRDFAATRVVVLGESRVPPDWVEDEGWA